MKTKNECVRSSDNIDQIQIVQYREELAEAVADMWNHSRDGWGGGDTISTAEQVRNQEANSDKLNLYLAMEGDTVVGYCGLSQYKEDYGALYIPLLNVRDDYHGKKIGKKLVLKAVERTIELGWARLDLYTWPGNTKAVPLYKKCGFFWEEKDNSTHLMNFIPTVMQTEAIKSFFDTIDWYNDSQRVIEVKPDGRKENDFDYFEYKWEKNNESLRLEFERKGRGLRLIETNDYFISATVNDAKPVFGKSYTVQYEIINKSGQPLHVELNGSNDKNIAYECSESVQVSDRVVIEKPFYVGPIDEEQSEWRTHPCVTTTLKINGKAAMFKVGVCPQFPAKLKTTVRNVESFVNQETTMTIDIENNFKEDVSLSFTLPSNNIARIEKEEWKVYLKANERFSLEVPCKPLQLGFYEADVDIKVESEQGVNVSFTKKIGAAFKGIGARFHGECDDYWHIYNGRYHVLLNKFNNEIIPGLEMYRDHEIFIFNPKIGKPYSDELAKTKPVDVQFTHEQGAIQLTAIFESKEKPGLLIQAHAELFAEGLMKQWYTLVNKAQETQRDVWIQQAVFYDLYRSIIPYRNEIIEMKDSDGNNYGYWDHNDITENWMFTNSRKQPVGISWPRDEKVYFANWFMYFEYEAPSLHTGEAHSTKPICINLGAYHDWSSFRTFALNRVNHETLTTSDHVQVEVNNGNVVVKEDISVQLIDQKTSYFDGQVSAVMSGADTLQSISVAGEEKKTTLDFDLPTSKKPIDTVRVTAELKTTTYEREALVLQPTAENIRCQVKQKDGMSTYILTNGNLQFKVTPDFFAAIHSMTYKGEEWMHSSYPTLQAKAWWNPWAGGTRNTLMGFNLMSMAKEKVKADFTTLTDQFGNEWTGIKISMSVEKHEKQKGLSFDQYFVTLPGVPAIAHTTEVTQQTGRLFYYEEWMTDVFIKSKGWASFQTDKNVLKRYNLRQAELDIDLFDTVRFGSIEQEAVLHLTTPIVDSSEHIYACLYSNKEVTNVAYRRPLHLKSGVSTWIAPMYYVFNDASISDEALKSLYKLRFSKK